jgi:hypothetical protein
MPLNKIYPVSKCILCFAFITLLIPDTAISQDWLGYNTSNYSGINNIFSQPASIADNRLRYDVNILAFNFTVANNFLGIDPAVLRSPTTVGNYNFKNTFLHEMPSNGQPKNIFLSLDMIGPSVMLTLSNKSAVGLFTRSRLMLNLDDVNEELAHNIYNHFEDTSFFKRSYSDDNISFQLHTWMEYGLTYARVVYDHNSHFVKAGANVKILTGLGSAYIFIKDFNYNLPKENYIKLLTTNVDYGHADNFNFGLQSTSGFYQNYKISTGYSVGFDFGAVYEYRPNYQEFRKDLDGKPNVPYRDKNKYLVKVGLSITDIGSVKYTKAPLSANFQTKIQDINLDTFANIHTITHLDSFVGSMFVYTPGDSNSTYNMSLPTAISLQIDFHVFKGFYLNFTPFFALKNGSSDVNKTHYFSTYSLTPRWENKRMGAYIPISYNKVMGFNMGIGLRYGPLVIGTSNLVYPFISNTNFSGMNFYFMLKIPMSFRHRKDADDDGVSDKYDLCINIPGTWESKGCPDSDSDGIADMYDDCPKSKGLAKFNGCPDTDNDGIPDNRDECPNVFGPAINSGCPDIDGDGVYDENDSCPDVKGVSKFNGCPDNDSDNVPDKIDKCPNKSGSVLHDGCPDSDGDGIYDDVDKCPELPGIRALDGCPNIDTDKDGVPDYLDKCPSVPGDKDNSGCPYGDKDKDGVLDNVDKCPDVAGPPENFGCPYPDTDNDGIPDKDDKCPNTPGTKANNGCP